MTESASLASAAADSVVRLSGGAARGEGVRSGREAGAGPQRSGPGPGSGEMFLRLSGWPRTACGRRRGRPSPSQWNSFQGNHTGRKRRDAKGPSPHPAPGLRPTRRAEKRWADDPIWRRQWPLHGCRGCVLRHHQCPHGYNPRLRRLRRPRRIRTPGPTRCPKRAPACLVGGVLGIESRPKVDECTCPVKLSGPRTWPLAQPETSRSRASNSSRRSSALTSG